MKKSVLNVVTDFGYGGVQQVAGIIDSALTPDDCQSSTIALNMFWGTHSETWLLRWLRTAKKYRQFLKSNSYDVVILHHLVPAILLPIGLSTKSIYVMHGPVVVPGSSWAVRLKSRLLHFFCGLRADRIVVVSAAIGHDFPFFFHHKLITIHNAPSLSFYDHSDHKAFDYLLDYRGIRLVHFGRLCHQKNQVYSIRILCKLQKRGIKAQLFFIGDGPDYAELVDFAKSMQMRVCQIGQVPSAVHDVVFVGALKGLAWIANYFDAALFPSRYEGFPLSIIECLSIGLPLASSDCSHGPREIFTSYFRADSDLMTQRGRMELLPHDVESDEWLDDWCKAVLDLKSNRADVVSPNFELEVLAEKMRNSWRNVVTDL